MFVTYLTVYSGEKLPPFYIGSTTEERLAKGYHGSIRSVKYRLVWEHEIKFHPDLFETRILSTHSDREEALAKEEEIQKLFDVVRSPLFANMAYARGGFINPGSFSNETRAKMSASAKAWRRGEKIIKAQRVLLGPEGMKANATRKRLAKAALKRSLRPIKMPKPIRVKMCREEINTHISDALTGHSVSEETRMKISDANKLAAKRLDYKGRKQSPEQVAKRVASRKQTLMMKTQNTKALNV
jgi:hypothetical protein